MVARCAVCLESSPSNGRADRDRPGRCLLLDPYVPAGGAPPVCVINPVAGRTARRRGFSTSPTGAATEVGRTCRRNSIVG
jgi:hypothetical protein